MFLVTSVVTREKELTSIARNAGIPDAAGTIVERVLAIVPTSSYWRADAGTHPVVALIIEAPVAALPSIIRVIDVRLKRRLKVVIEFGPEHDIPHSEVVIGRRAARARPGS